MQHSDQHGSSAAQTEFLSFQLGGLDYGVEFGKVKELRSLKSLERFAADGAVLKGVALSRGVIMPLVDMRAAVAGRVGASAGSIEVIILQLGEGVMGMVVDGVTEVVRIAQEQISAIPRADPEGECDYLIGLADSGGRRLILVDIERLMSIQQETQPVRAVA